MAFDIKRIAAVYTGEKLNFSTDEENQRIDFNMNTEVARDVHFVARIVNPRTAMFTTVLPMNVPEANRPVVAEYLARVNYGLLLGNFQLDMSDGEISYKTIGCFEEEGEAGLPDGVVARLTFVGFNMFDKYVPGVFAIIYGGKQPKEAYDEIESKED